MNFLGKVFVVLVLVMSIIFMSFAIVVYTTHKNWSQLAANQQTRLTAAQAEIARLQSQHDRQVEQLAAERLAAEQQVAKLETERTTLTQTNAGILNELDTLKSQERDRLASFTSTQKNNEDLSAQVAELSRQKRESELARDAQYAQMLAATEQRNQLVGQLETATERNIQLTTAVANMTQVMQANGLDPATDVNAVTPMIDGIVSQIRRSGGVQYVEVSIGADDGLKAGDKVEVFRGSKYLGRLDIMETSPNKAVGQVNRNFLQGQIQEGDRVATRLNF
jgi:cell division protein FtsL